VLRLQEVAGPYAAVVIATPLEGARIRFKGFGVRPQPAREYQRVTTTYVAGRLRASYFGVARMPTGATPHLVPRS
jgi:Prenylcysteine lyase